MKIYIGNLSRKVTDAEFVAVAALFGTPESATIARGPGGESKGFAFAEYPDEDEGRAAIEGFQGRDFAGNVLWASEASEKPAAV
jgi:RNA recognition motif-containing protein